MIELITNIFKVFGTKSDRDLKEMQPLVDKVHIYSKELASLDHDQLRNKTIDFRKQIADHISAENAQIEELKKLVQSDSANVDESEEHYKKIDNLEKNIQKKIDEKLLDLLPEAFAVVKETAKRFKENKTIEVTATQMDRDLAARKDSVDIKGENAVFKNSWSAAGTEVTWDMVHYDVQLVGGVVLHQGKIAEMATGEGKTLVGTLPVYLNALSGNGVHLVTVNTYLSKRDSEWMGPLFEFHGLSVDCIDKYEPNSDARRKAYMADITYGTNNEFGFDYLRDNMARNPEDLVQRKHNYAIVDEVDSVLIDDARTPLIISGPTPKGDKHEFFPMKPKIEKLVAAQKQYVTSILSEAKKLLAENNEKDAGLPLLRAFRGLPKNKALIKFLNESGAKQLLQKTENFYMQDQSKEMHKVDAELYFVIDEKHNSIELTEKGIELITTSSEDTDFFILPDVGTLIADIEKSTMSDEEKLAKKDSMMTDYAIKAERIHTINQLLKAYTLFEKDVDYVLMDSKVKIVDEQTGRIMEGRRYSDGLHQAIEAKENVKIEAATQTYSTITLQNYFRMYNKLAGMTGTAETEAGELWDIYKLDVMVIPTNRPIVRKDQEDLVYKTKREKYNAAIEEIEKLNKDGRPVLVGTTSVEISELLSRMLKMKNIKHNVLNAKLHQKEADIVAEAGKPGAVTIATNMAGRGTDIKITEEVKKSGGLAIVGTERHESRRVDRQLRGRSGRQGDPGTTQFFVSLDDDLMRLFGSGRIASLMDKMGLKEGEVIQHSMITKSIERAQRKVEENNFGIRKRLLEYDDVMNSQREVIYTKRRHALYGERLEVDIANMIYDTCESIVNVFQSERNFEGFKLELIRNLSVSPSIDEQQFLKMNSQQLVDLIYNEALKKYADKKEVISKTSYPVIKGVFENQGNSYENIVVPFTDGIKTMQVVTNLKKAYESNGKSIIKSFEEGIILSIIDEAWKEHLREMDDLKQSVQNAVYEQKDPLLVYKFESFELFKRMLDKINKEIISFLMKANLPVQNPDSIQQAKAPIRTTPLNLKASRSDQLSSNGNGEQQERKLEPVRVEQRAGRNDPCPCGSGKKFKQCHGKE
ncbi:MAG: preprotein translocase subunit SecA [Bacteroidota bacterium]|nr:preprotein translocase subunit SecA [Bacteroidota bacterium]